MTNVYDTKGKKIWVTGHNGLVGSALVRCLQDEDCEVVFAERNDLDLQRQNDVEQWMDDVKPDVVVVAAAIVGGIHANDTQPVEFIYNNLMIESNVINSAYKVGVEKLLFLGSSCVYPKMAPQPIKEQSLLTGSPEPTNEWYSVAKIAGIKLCQAYRKQYGRDFISAIPTNLYGPKDNFDLSSSHVGAALMVKAHKAKLAGQSELEIWGSGTPLRELMYVDDVANGLVFLLQNYSEEMPINIGCGEEISIKNLAKVISGVVGYEGAFVFDAAKPDGAPRKALDSSRIHDMGWRASTSIEAGMKKTYEWYLQNIE
ncbi:MAG: GDP-L-fucose synthase [Rhodospirillales bacterium]|nr:GDP-L-fucose synthase [Rhodospirillales bacterium]